MASSPSGSCGATNGVSEGVASCASSKNSSSLTVPRVSISPVGQRRIRMVFTLLFERHLGLERGLFRLFQGRRCGHRRGLQCRVRGPNDSWSSDDANGRQRAAASVLAESQKSRCVGPWMVGSMKNWQGPKRPPPNRRGGSATHPPAVGKFVVAYRGLSIGLPAATRSRVADSQCSQ